MYYFKNDQGEQNFSSIEECRVAAIEQGFSKFRCQNGGEYFIHPNTRTPEQSRYDFTRAKDW
jgi:hypothetical protein